MRELIPHLPNTFANDTNHNANVRPEQSQIEITIIHVLAANLHYAQAHPILHMHVLHNIFKWLKNAGMVLLYDHDALQVM